MNKISFGSFSNVSSFTHKLDARNKLIMVVMLMVLIFLPFSLLITRLIFALIFLIISIIFMIISRVSFLGLLNNLKGMWLMIIFIFAIYIFIPTGKSYSHIAFNITSSWPVYYEAFVDAGYIILRLIIMMALMMILTSTTSPMALTDAFEWYMLPLKVIHFPTHEIAMTLSIALRFIPTLLDETERIMNAQSSRGVDFNHGRLLKRFKAIISLIIPLFVSSIERSEELANAMEARGYDPHQKRTKFHIMHFSLRDLFSFIFIVLLLGLVIFLSCYDKKNTIDLLKLFFNISSPF